jgi:hypothetical protein
MICKTFIVVCLVVEMPFQCLSASEYATTKRIDVVLEEFE